jgi:peptidoglycan/LPS O-acetylase OafA/YrhL
MLYHYSVGSLSGLPLRLMQHGYLAVDLFFVLSGFVMAMTYGASFRHLPTLRTYFEFLQKRLARVYPLYLAVTLLTAWLIYSRAMEGVRPTVGVVAANVLLVQAWGFAASLCGPSWSISTEFAAYLFFPFLVGAIVFGAPRWRRAAMAAGVLLLLYVVTRTSTQLHFDASQGVQRHGPLDIYAPGTVFPMLRCFAEFLMGIAAFPFVLGRRFTGAYWGVTTDALVALVLTLLLWPRADAAIALLFVPLVALLFAQRGYAVRLMSNPVSHWLGLVSYSIYMDHFVIHELLGSRMRDLLTALHVGHVAVLRGMLLVALSLTAAALTYYGIEKPVRERLRPRSPRRGARLNSALIAEPSAP